jgi:prepilin-type N-terminal cleavage/methylation domain-containing protein
MQAGFSLLELVVVVAIVAVAASIAVPSITTAMRVSAYKSTIATTVDRLATLRAGAARGSATTFSTADMVLEHGSMVVNSPSVAPPDGAVMADSMTFQGGTGHCFAGGAVRSAAIVLANASDPAEAYAIVVGSTSRISTKRLTAHGWEDYAQ